MKCACLLTDPATEMYPEMALYFALFFHEAAILSTVLVLE